jgi:hypothetical protein
MFTQHLQYKMFISFDCSGVPSRTGLQSATLSMYQSEYVGLDPSDTIAVRHVIFDSVDYAHWMDAALDNPGNTGPSNSTIEYKTLDVTSSSQADLSASRSLTQFRLELITSVLQGNKQYIGWQSVGEANPPRLRLRFLIP